MVKNKSSIIKGEITYLQTLCPSQRSACREAPCQVEGDTEEGASGQDSF